MLNNQMNRKPDLFFILPYQPIEIYSPASTVSFIYSSIN